jgi:hypothetical protein
VSVFSSTPTLAQIVIGFPWSGKTIPATPAATGQSVHEKLRASMDALYERMLYAAAYYTGAIDPVSEPLDSTPINPDSLAPFAYSRVGLGGAVVVNDGLEPSQMRHRCWQTVVDSEIPAHIHQPIVEEPFVPTAIPKCAGFRVEWVEDILIPPDMLDPYIIAPQWRWSGNGTIPNPPRLSFILDGMPTYGEDPVCTPGEAVIYLWEIGEAGTGFTKGADVSVPDYDTISDATIAAGAYQNASLLRMFRNRLDHLKGMLDGEPTAPRILAQAFAIQTSGNNKGITVNQHRHTLFTITGQTVAAAVGEAPGETLISTGILASQLTQPEQAIPTAITGTNYELQLDIVTKSLAGNPTYYVRARNYGSAVISSLSIAAYFIHS